MIGKPHGTGRITRKEFIRRAGVGAAAVGAAAVGLSGTVRAAPGNANIDPGNIDGDAGDQAITVYPTGTMPPMGLIKLPPQKSAFPATGTTFTIDDGVHDPVTFFIKNGTITGAGVLIDITKLATNVLIGNAIATAINGAGLNVYANGDPNDGRIYLAYDYVSDPASNGNAVAIDPGSYPGGAAKIYWAPGSSQNNDIRNIQWAVDNVQPGGTVFLRRYTSSVPTVRSNFEFGVIGHVVVENDVTLQGDADVPRQPPNPDGAGGWVLDGTTIHGGERIRFGDTKRVSFSVKDIIFDGTYAGAIFGNNVKGDNEISGCQFVNLWRGRLLNVGAVMVPIVVGGGITAEDIANCSGALKKTNNRFGAPVNHVDPVTPTNNINSFVSHVNSCTLDLEISRNVVDDCVFASFLVWLNMGFTRISNNTITKTGKWNNLPGAALSIGGTLPGYFTPLAYNGSAEITDNTIASSEDGIVITDYPQAAKPETPSYFLVSGNRIDLAGSPGAAIGCYGSCKDATWVDNRVTGSGNYGIRLNKLLPAGMQQPVGDAFVSANNFSGNDFTGFTAANSQVHLDEFARDNYFGPGSDPNTGLEYAGNSFGPSGLYQAIVQGNSNIFDSNTFGSSRWEQMDITNASADKTKLDSGCYNILKNNVFGPVLNFPPGDPFYSPREAVRVISGDFNQLIKNDYTQTGLPGLTDPNRPPSGANMPCISLTGFSGQNKFAENNLVFESGGFPVVNGVETDAKTQVFDYLLMPWSPTYPNTNNRVIGHSANTYQSAVYKNSGIGQSLQAAGGELDCVLSGGAWDPAAKVCSCPAGCTLNPATGKCEKALAPED